MEARLGLTHQQILSYNPRVLKVLSLLLVGVTLMSGAAPSAICAQQSDGSQTNAESQSDQAELPQKFDLRERGVVSPVKNQNPWGACWAFGALAASESSILSELGTTYEAHPLDLSPRHLAWFANTALPNRQVMENTQSLSGYASQAGEGTTVLHSSDNDHAHPLETGGSPFLPQR